MDGPRIAVLTSLIMAGALTACTPSNYEKGSSANEYRPEYANYTQTYMASTSIGQVVTTPQGFTVYTFDMDQKGHSACYGTCAQHWPPVLAADGAKPQGHMSLVTRDDGPQQWTYDGLPLYTFAGDAKPGDVNGDDVGNVWHVVR